MRAGNFENDPYKIIKVSQSVSPRKISVNWLFIYKKLLGTDLSDFYADKICPASRQDGCTFFCFVRLDIIW